MAAVYSEAPDDPFGVHPGLCLPDTALGPLLPFGIFYKLLFH